MSDDGLKPWQMPRILVEDAEACNGCASGDGTASEKYGAMKTLPHA